MPQGTSEAPGDAWRRGWLRKLVRATAGDVALRRTLILVWPVFWLGLFLISPLVIVFFYGFGYTDDAYLLQLWPFDPSNYLDALNPSAIVIPFLARTFAIAFATTLVSLFFGYCIAYYIARITKEKNRGFLMALIIVPFWISFIVRIYGLFPFVNEGSWFHDALRSSGLGALSSFIAAYFAPGTGGLVIFTLMYVWLPFMILPLFASLSKLDPTLLEAAYDLGASRLRAFFSVTLPLTYPAIIVGSVLVFITTAGEFVTPDIVGGRRWYFIGNYIQGQFSLVGGLPQAAASAVFIILVTVALISTYRRYAELQEGQIVGESRVVAFLRSLVAQVRLEKVPSPVAVETPDGPVRDLDAEPVVATKHEIVGGVPKAWWERALDVVAERAGKYVLGILTYGMIVLFFLPLVVVGVFSFNGVDSIDFFQCCSVAAYLGSPDRDGLQQDPQAIRSIWGSFLVAGASAGLALFFGLLAAFAINRYAFRLREALHTTMYLGLVIPSIVLGISTAILMRFLNIYLLGPLSMGFGAPTPFEAKLGFWTVLIGHTTFNIPLATLVLLISFREFDRTLEEAAMNLGADELTTFLRVTLPNIAPGIISAVLLAFTFSFDELPVTLFLYGEGPPSVSTIPVFIYGLISKKILGTRVNAASTLVLILSFVFVLASTKLVKRGGQLFRI